MPITEISTIHHVAIVFVLLWVLAAYGCSHPLLYLVCLIYLYQVRIQLEPFCPQVSFLSPDFINLPPHAVHERYIIRLSKKFQFEQTKQANQRRVLLDSESVRWLNHAIEKIWPICMEQIVSQKILLPIIPWFLDKYKPWTVSEADVQSLYLGRNPPIFTEMKVFHESTDDDHLVLKAGLNFLAADDMSAVLTSKLRKRLGFGMSTKLHLTGMHVEGKVLIGVKFLRAWPFISRLRVCFAEPPYFQMIVKPIFSHGLDVTDLPGIAGWLDNLLAVAFEETLVEPNMLVFDLVKFVSSEPENWFSVDVKDPVTYVRVEVIEASNMKPSDSNGLADPYVEGQLGPCKFKTRIHRKTLNPKWQEEYKIPISSWELNNVLAIRVRDKDPIIDDNLGVCSVNINTLTVGQRHDMWVPLENVKTGRLHLAITVIESDGKVRDPTGKHAAGDTLNNRQVGASETALVSTVSSMDHKAADVFEAIDKEAGIWIYHPGSEIAQTWEPRKGRKGKHTGSEIFREDLRENSPRTSNASSQGPNLLLRGLQKFNDARHRQHNLKREDDSSGFAESTTSSPHPNVKPINTNRIGVNLVVEDSLSRPLSTSDMTKGERGGERSSDEISGTKSAKVKTEAKEVAKNIFKQAGKSAKSFKHVFSKKGSKHFRRSSEGIKESEISDFVSESFHDESPCYKSSMEGSSILSKQYIGDASFGSQDHVHTATSKPIESRRLEEHERGNPELRERR